jgi:murein DD-endopeptidase MepM/ murein hydrolase activator NlpD
MRHLVLLFVLVVLVSAAHAENQILFDLTFPSVRNGTNANKFVTGTVGQIHGSDRHFHAGIDIGVEDAKIIAAHSGFISQIDNLGNPDLRYLVVSYYNGTPLNPDFLFFSTRYLHCAPKENFVVGRSLNPGNEFATPLTNMDDYAPHLHFEVIRGTDLRLPGEYGNPLYNNLFFVYHPLTGQLLDRVIIDLFRNAVDGNSIDRNYGPLTGGSIDQFPPIIRKIEWQETKMNSQEMPVVGGNMGPIIWVGDQGVNQQYANTMTVYRADAYVRKNAESDYEWSFLTAFDHHKRTERLDANKVFTSGTTKFGNNDKIYLYKSYGGQAMSYHVLPTSSIKTYADLKEGRNTYLFAALGYESDFTVEMADPPVSDVAINSLPPGFVDDEFSADPAGESTGSLYSGGLQLAATEIVVDNDPNPRLTRLKAYQQRIVGSSFQWTLIYEWNNGSATSHDDFYSGSMTRILLSFSEDAYIDAATKLTIASNDIAPINMELDPAKGSAFGQAPTVFDEHIESYWLVEFPPTNTAGTAALSLSANDLADNSVSVSGGINLSFVLKSAVNEWRSYQ